MRICTFVVHVRLMSDGRSFFTCCLFKLADTLKLNNIWYLSIIDTHESFYLLQYFVYFLIKPSLLLSHLCVKIFRDTF